MPYKDLQKRKEYKRRYYIKNREKILEQAKEYGMRTKEVRSKKAKEYYEKNKERIKERVRGWRKEHKEEHLKSVKEWSKNNPEKRKAIVKRYYEKKKREDPEYFNQKARKEYNSDIEKSREKLREYRQKNPIKTRLWKYNRRVRSGFTTVDKEHMTKRFEDAVLQRLKEQDYKCLYCGKDIEDDFSIDHIIPLSRGGTNEPDNIDLVCKDCNTRKSTRTKSEYLSVLDNQPDSSLTL
ncbi:MAG TPA: HNH endonuclease [Candidatus Dojkabacteria bacterium]|nr:HNH endonuclease [Candidatus Dojkabacteria bacterium]